MTREEFENWCRENSTGHKVNKSCNGIDWVLVAMKDGWIAIFEYDYCSAMLWLKESPSFFCADSSAIGLSPQ